jgi:hypothetical protein
MGNRQIGGPDVTNTAALATSSSRSKRGCEAKLINANNQFLIALQCEEATYVAGFRKWLQLGYAVRRGEISIRIWMPPPPTKKALAEWEANGATKKDKPETRFRLGPVFDTLSRDRLGGLSREAVARLKTLDSGDEEIARRRG